MVGWCETWGHLMTHAYCVAKNIKSGCTCYELCTIQAQAPLRPSICCTNSSCTVRSASSEDKFQNIGVVLCWISTEGATITSKCAYCPSINKWMIINNWYMVYYINHMVYDYKNWLMCIRQFLITWYIIFLNEIIHVCAIYSWSSYWATRSDSQFVDPVLQ